MQDREIETQSNTKILPSRKKRIYEKYVKRMIDILLAGTALIVLSPLFLLIAIAVRINLGSPVLFKQKRIGVGEKVFTLIKFRSMRDARDSFGNYLPDTQRLTRFGRFLRSTSMDELPEFLCVLRGEMSLIGPRPLPEVYLPYYRPKERLRHTIRGGLTGLAQVEGRNALTWEQRFEYDIFYTQHVCFALDVSIFVKTIKVILQRSNIGERGVSTPEDLDYVREVQR